MQTRLRPELLAAKARLADGFAQLKARHEQGRPALEVCAALTDLRDEVLLSLFREAIAAQGPDLASRVALIAHSGQGRRDLAPFSDVDLMLLHEPAAGPRIGPVAERFLCDVFDAGLVLGHSVRTPVEACQLAAQDATILSSLVEARMLTGSEAVLADFHQRFRRQVGRRATPLLAAVEQSRSEERL
jgi:[protein-PII] uridylyltransferase